MRLSFDRRGYPRRWERALDAALPAQPAAVPIYDTAGESRLLVVDLDASRGTVDTDAAALRTLFDRCGLRYLSDSSPSGGQHLYVPFVRPVPFVELRELAVDLAVQTPSMDTSPNSNVTEGLIRPPGSLHRSGGWQILDGPIDTAVAILTAGNNAAALARLRAAVPNRTAIVGDSLDDPIEADAIGPSRHRTIHPDTLAIATNGRYDDARYRSPSEARGAVIMAAARAGLTVTDVLQRLADGRWRGLAALYAAKYRNRAAAVRGDWDRALDHLRKQPNNADRVTPVRRSPTSEHLPRRGDTGPAKLTRGSDQEYLWLRTWWSGLRAGTDRWTGKSLGLRMVARAVGEAAMKVGSRYVAFGTRNLSIATGLDHTTVAAHLRELRAEHDPLLVLIENDRGLGGDLYELRIPHAVAARAERAPWPKGRQHALRPAFRELGLPAAFVYETLETARGSLTSFEIAERTSIGRSTVYEALQTLAAWDLAERDADGRWRLGAGDLTQLARLWGIDDDIRTQHARHQAERTAYRAALRLPPPHDPHFWIEATLAPDDWTPHLAGDPHDPWASALSLLDRELGGRALDG